MTWRMPAEWEPHRATWLVWPHNPETWPGWLDRAEAEFATLVTTLCEYEAVRLVVQDKAHTQHVRERLGSAFPHNLELVQIPTNDAWIRDTGPTFVVDDQGDRRALDWVFNTWGGKYPPWDADDAVARAVAHHVGVPCERIELVAEGGALEVDGQGTLITTRSTLLSHTRNPEYGEDALGARLSELLGLRRVIWLDAAIEGDDTDGHIDDIARFFAPGFVVCAVEPDACDPNHSPLEACRRELERATDAQGRPIHVVDLPMPPPLEAFGERIPASYANFYLANGAVLVPTFGTASDTQALSLLGKLFPAHAVRAIPSRVLVRGLGSVHCLTQQEPASTAT